MKALTYTIVASITLMGAFIIAPSVRSDESLNVADLPSAVSDEDFYENGRPSVEKVNLGRFLFFDKILSGNQNISCATCHHPEFGTSDGLSLPFGEGPSGLGTDRKPGRSKSSAIHERVPRNSPALFNLGAEEFTRMFHDGRVEIDPDGYYEGGFITPAKWKLPVGLDNVLAAQAMFPVTSPTEMAGQKGENKIAEARSLNNAAGQGGVWDLIANRLRAVPEYVDLFKAAYPSDVAGAEDVTFVLAANAIAAFESKAFRADNSPFDEYLRSGSGLSVKEERGMKLFYGRANCQSCHSGKFQTDHDFHAIAMPQIGPGKADGSDQDFWRETGMQAYLEDFGRGRVSVRDEDNFKFRTPSLRNVELTGPWGHDGAYSSLEDIIRHHLNPIEALESYDVENASLPKIERALELTADGPRFEQSWLSSNRLNALLAKDSWIQKNEGLRQKIAEANELQTRHLSDEDVDYLMAFLLSLTDPASRDLSSEVPKRVPSGLPVVD